MLDEAFDIYVRSNIALVKSFVIKSDMTAELLNNHFDILGEYIDPVDKRTWKYYMNLSGSYYVSSTGSAFTSDKMMSIVSSDDQTELDYTKANLDISPITKITLPSHIDGIITKNPEQEILIRGIANPVDIDAAIEAEDFTLLNYDSSLIAGNEVSLIEKTQAWIYSFAARWYKEDYQLTDPYYTAAFIATMCIQLPSVIMNLRLAACHTPEVGTYHLWNYLSGHYSLNRFRDHLSISQALWLYRNAIDIQRNAGKEWVMEELLKQITSPKGLQAVKYDFVKSEKDFLSNGRHNASYIERDYEETSIDILRDDLINESNVLYQTIDKAAKNEDELEADVDELEYSGRYEAENNLPTGLVRVNLDTNFLSQLANDTQLRMDYWILLSSKGLYTESFTFDVPGSGSVVLNAKEAFVLFMYATNASLGIDMDSIPEIEVKNVISYAAGINIASFRDTTPVDRVSDDTINEALADRIPNIMVSNPRTLEDYVEKIINRRILHTLQLNETTDPTTMSFMENVVYGCYNYEQVKFVDTPTDYNDWLSINNINKYSLSKLDWHDLMQSILLTVTGIDPNNKGIAPGKKAMIEILDILTSYNVIIQEGDSDANYKSMDYAFMYFHEPKTIHKECYLIEAGDMTFVDESESHRQTHAEDMDLINPQMTYNPEDNAIEFDIPVGVDIEEFNGYNQTNNIDVGIHIYDFEVIRTPT